MRLIYLIFISLFFSILSFFSQAQLWDNFTNKDIINDIDFFNDSIWVSTTGGVVVRDLNGVILKKITKKDGLVSNRITCCLIDGDGNKWFGSSEAGISKFDGTNWTNYDTANSDLGDDRITSLSIDNQGVIWAGTLYGVLSAYNGSNWINYNDNNGFNNTNAIIRKIKVLNDSTILVSSCGNGLFKIQNGIFTNYNTSNSGIFSNCIYDIETDNNGKIWIATDVGLASFDNSIWTLYNTSNSGIINNNLLSIEFENNYLWIGSYNTGVYKFNMSNWTNYQTSNSQIISNSIPAILIDPYGKKWFGTNEKNISIYENGNWINLYNENDDILRSACYTMAEDNFGKKWFGTYYGISKFNGYNMETLNNFPQASTFNNNGGDLVKAMCFDQSGQLWFGGGGAGVWKYNPQTNIYELYDNQNCHMAIGIKIDASGNIWILSQYFGINKFDGNNWINYNKNNSGLNYNYNLFSFDIDNQNDIWVTTDNGLYKFNGTNWSSISIPNQFSAPIKYVHSDINGNIWIATESDIQKYDGINFVVYPFTQLLNNVGAIITGIDSDNNGTVWISTQGYGLLKYDGLTWRKYTFSNSGLTENYLSFVLVNNDDVWIGSNDNGVYCMLSEANQTIISVKRNVTGKIFFDENNNQIKDSSEFYLSNRKVFVLPDSLYVFTSTVGQYNFLADTNRNYTIYTTNDGNWLTSSPDSISFFLDSIDYEVQDLPLVSIDTHLIDINLISDPNHCGVITSFWINYNNLGTNVENGSISVVMDPLVTIISSNPPFISNVSNQLFFNFDSLIPGIERQIHIQALLPNELYAGSILNYSTQLNTTSGLIDFDTLTRILSCSYDPNFIEVFPNRNIYENYVLKTETLDYIIHFQNTGNDTASTIVLIDTLDNIIDLNSIKIVSSSHNVNLSINNNGVMKFLFQNINLPDSSTNETLSHGFVNFKANIKHEAEKNYTISNQAFIYFDNNQAIITNNVINTIYECNNFESLILNDSVLCQGDLLEFTINDQYPNTFFTWNINNQSVGIGDTLNYIINTNLINLNLSINNELCLVDSTINFEIDNCAGFNEEINQELVIYPNPCFEYVTIKSSYLNDISYNLKDLSGRKIDVNNYQNNSSIELDLKNINSGIYIIEIYYKNSPINLLKLILKE